MNGSAATSVAARRLIVAAVTPASAQALQRGALR